MGACRPNGGGLPRQRWGGTAGTSLPPPWPGWPPGSDPRRPPIGGLCQTGTRSGSSGIRPRPSCSCAGPSSSLRPGADPAGFPAARKSGGPDHAPAPAPAHRTVHAVLPRVKVGLGGACSTAQGTPRSTAMPGRNHPTTASRRPAARPTIRTFTRKVSGLAHSPRP